MFPDVNRNFKGLKQNKIFIRKKQKTKKPQLKKTRLSRF